MIMIIIDDGGNSTDRERPAGDVLQAGRRDARFDPTIDSRAAHPPAFPYARMTRAVH
jgi:hypothetical protein